MAGPLPHVSAGPSGEAPEVSILNALMCPGNLELSRAVTLTAPWTLSGWFKRSELTSLNNLLGTTGSAEVRFNANDTITAEALTTTAVFRDVNAWYHIYVSDNGLFVNGSFYGAATTTNLADPIKLVYDFDGYAAEIHLQSGTNPVTNFGEFDGSIWKPKAAASGLHHLKFENNANLGENSGTGGDWTATGFAAANQVTDIPTDNYATLYPLDPVSTMPLLTGNISYQWGSAGWAGSVATLDLTNLNYCETVVKTTGHQAIGICTGRSQDGDPTTKADAWVMWTNSTTSYDAATLGSNTANTNPAMAAPAIDQVMMGAFNKSSGNVWFGVNGVWGNFGNGIGDPANDANPAFTLSSTDREKHVFFMVSGQNIGAVADITFGQRAFAHTPPTNFTGVNTANMPDPGALVTPLTSSDAIANGDFVYLGWTPDQSLTSTIGATTLVWGTNADALANGVKSRGAAGTGYSIEVKQPFGGAGHSPSPAQGNPE